MFQTNLTAELIGRALRSALSKSMLRDEDTSMIFYDLDFLEKRIRYLQSCFPPNTLHGLAVKANPLIRVMQHMSAISPGIGVEAASISEVNMALYAGYEPWRVVFDSPVKTESDLNFSVEKGIHLNIDNLSELSRVNGIILSKPSATAGTAGIRINPQVGVGTILESSVAGEYSKFGVPITTRRAELEQAFLAYPWLTGVHLHVGSQGCPMEMLIDGIGILYDFVLEMNTKRSASGFPPISIFDIGGGLPISYHAETPAPSMEEYVQKIGLRSPLLTDPAHFKLITEFGRWSYTNSGWTVSRVEYVKRDPAINTAMIHVGADLFVRECLNPKDWHHEYSVFDKNGSLKTGKDDHPYNLAGPLCFAGDIVAKNVSLPVIEEGDFLVIHDTGGYTFSMWSRYNSRQTPRILGYRGDNFEVLKERETVEEVMGFWE